MPSGPAFARAGGNPAAAPPGSLLAELPGHGQTPGPGSQQVAAHGTRCSAVPAASRQSLAVPTSSLGSRRLSASATALVLRPHPIGRPRSGRVWRENFGAARDPGRSLESRRAMRGDAGPWLPRLPTLSGSVEGLGGGRQRRPEGREGSRGLGGAAADSPVEREICSQARRRHLQTTPAPLAQHGTAWHSSRSGW